MFFPLRFVVIGLTCLLVPAAIVSQEKKAAEKKAAEKKLEKKKAGVFLSAKEAGAEFAVQGEYEGAIGGEKFGAQVVALGNNKFDVVLEKGGLPGAGWDGKTKIKASAVLEPEGAVAKIEGKAIEGKDKSGQGIVGEIKLGEPATLTGKLGDAEIKMTRVERKSPTLGAQPPEGALILFDGNDASHWNNGKVIDGLLRCGTNCKKQFKEFKLHIEFRTPFQPTARGQGRGNSGVYLHGRHEVQVLDSFGLKGENNECGGFYGRKAPAVNMCFPPLSWQTYDIDVKVDPSSEKKMRYTVAHNGVTIHDAIDFPAGSGGLNLQDHGNAVFYRNIWVVEPK